MKKIIVLVLFLSGCSYSPQYHIVRDAFNSQTYAPSSPMPQRQLTLRPRPPLRFLIVRIAPLPNR